MLRLFARLIQPCGLRQKLCGDVATITRQQDRTDGVDFRGGRGRVPLLPWLRFSRFGVHDRDEDDVRYFRFRGFPNFVRSGQWYVEDKFFFWMRHLLRRGSELLSIYAGSLSKSYNAQKDVTCLSSTYYHALRQKLTFLERSVQKAILVSRKDHSYLDMCSSLVVLSLVTFRVGIGFFGGEVRRGGAEHIAWMPCNEGLPFHSRRMDLFSAS